MIFFNKICMTVNAVNVVAIRQGDAVSVEIDPNHPLEQEMKLIIIADTAKIKKLK